jgi:hypothetical protein
MRAGFRRARLGDRSGNSAGGAALLSLNDGVMRTNVHAVVVAVAVIACNAITGANGLTVEDEAPIGLPDGGTSSSSGQTSSSTSSSGSVDDAGTIVPLAGWAYRRVVTLASDAPGDLANHPVLVTLPDGFDGGNAQADGKDIRFKLPDGQTELDYFIERWTPGTPKIVWVKMPALKPGSSELVIFYGNANATATSDFAKTFVRVQKTAGNGGGNFTASADIDVDWFELAAGDTLTLQATKPLRITASRVIIAGTVQGNEKGFASGAAANTNGDGPGGGKAAAGSGAGGAGHGGAGGQGGADTVDAGGAGGPITGSPDADDADPGSGGGRAGTTAGGPGGGAISIHGWRTTISGTITVNGAAGITTSTGTAGGGGAGGAILIAGLDLDLAGAKLSAIGGAGGNATDPLGDAGGGGGGGRIKIRQRSGGSLVPAASSLVTRGTGGAGGTTAPGQPGLAGTIHTSTTATTMKGVSTALGPEVKL